MPMRPHTFLWFSVLILTACSSGQNKIPVTEKSSQDTPKHTFRYHQVIDTPLSYIDNYPPLREELNKKNFTKKGNYYMLIPFSDSAVKIAWGNDTLKRVYGNPLDFFSAYKLYGVKWENEYYLILLQGQGSGAWANIVLPINSSEKPEVIYNGLCFDTANNLMVSQEIPWSDPLSNDTILVVKNLRTHQNQFIIEKEKHCESANYLYCIDSISIHEKLLYYQWVTPNFRDENKKSVERRVRVKI